MKQTRKTTRIVKFSSPIRYQGNLLFLILFLLVWLPVGMLLALKNARLATESSTFYLLYQGKWGWLFFWGVLFFPIAILLLLVKGVDVVEEETILEQEIIIEKF